MGKNELIGQVSQEQIDKWKGKHKEIFQLKVEDRVCYVRKPDRKELSYAQSTLSKNPIAYNEYLLRTCWLGGDMEIQTNDSYFYGASSELSELIEVKESELLKL